MSRWDALATAALLALPAATLAGEKLASHVISVTNHRASPVLAIGFGADDSPVVPANLLKAPLRTDVTVKLTVRAPQGVCRFSVIGHFEDGTEFSGSGLDLCNDHALTLVD
ncbi:MAG: hypothetical protein U1E62_11115 [Alsobacter sp.]